MKKVIVFLTVAVALLLIGLFFLIFQPQFMRKSQTKIQSKAITPSTSQTKFQPFTAEFKIITDGLTRDFSHSRYHNKSSDVFIEPKQPNIVHVQKANITWGDFFKTLPMQLTDYCLTTGTNHVFCTGTAGELRFYLNEIETPKALEMRISPGDSFIAEYESYNQASSSASSSVTVTP